MRDDAVVVGIDDQGFLVKLLAVHENGYSPLLFDVFVKIQDCFLIRSDARASQGQGAVGTFDVPAGTAALCHERTA